MVAEHGRNVYVSLSTSDLSAFCNTSNYEKSADSHDVTTYGNNSHVFAGGLLTGTGTIGGFYDSATTGPRNIIEPLIGKLAVYVDRPIGSGTGKTQRTVSALVMKYTESRPVADMITWSLDLQFSGDVTVIAQT